MQPLEFVLRLTLYQLLYFRLCDEQITLFSEKKDVQRKLFIGIPATRSQFTWRLRVEQLQLRLPCNLSERPDSGDVNKQVSYCISEYDNIKHDWTTYDCVNLVKHVGDFILDFLTQRHFWYKI